MCFLKEVGQTTIRSFFSRIKYVNKSFQVIFQWISCSTYLCYKCSNDFLTTILQCGLRNAFFFISTNLLFSLGFYFPFLFGLLLFFFGLLFSFFRFLFGLLFLFFFRFSLGFFPLFSLDFYSISVTFWISFKFFLTALQNLSFYSA